MKAHVRVEPDHVAVQIGDLSMTFPDEPGWWAVMFRTVDAVQELGSGALDAEDG